MFVAIRPGQMQLTRMFSGAELRGRDVRHVHDGGLGDGIEDRAVARLQMPATEAVEMIEPPPCARISGTAYFMPNSAARTCRCMTESKPSAVTPSAGSSRAAGAGIVEEAVETAEMLCRRRHRVCDIALPATRRSAHNGPALVVFLDPGALVVLDVGGDDFRALGDEQVDRGPADAAGRARDDRDLAFQTSGHDILLDSAVIIPHVVDIAQQDVYIATHDALDPIALAQALIRCPSVTPQDAGALGVLEQALDAAGLYLPPPALRAGRHRAGRKSLCADRDAGRRISASPGTPMSCRRAMLNCGSTILSQRRSRTARSTAAAPRT